MKTYTEEEYQKAIQEKADLSFKAGFEKGKGSVDNSSLSKEVEDLKEALKEKDDKLSETLEILKPLQEKEQFAKDFESFTASNGKDDVDLSDYNYSKFKAEDGSIQWDKFLEKHPNLAKETKPATDPTLNAPTVTQTEVEASKAAMEKATADIKLANV